mgnify:CR=1 FL=1
MVSGQERRREERIRVSIPVRCHPSSEGKAFCALSIDLSFRGMRILSETFLPVDEIVRVDLYLDEGIVTLSSQTVWCKEGHPFDRYEVGLKFLGCEDDEGCRSLRAFLGLCRKDPTLAARGLPPEPPFLEIEPSPV